ncbi:Hypothetical Protein OBI_RACECAR_74 [Arthrobacter phage Racecar]|nr:hypothetical protein PBI_RACECAR_156 [Arthrobacter phage Racecar]QFG12830.1 hypothetical protein PBI_MIMI_153 [Arthrobacter phage Mimi]
MAFTLDVEPAQYINLDLFPAKVSAPSFASKHEEYRVIVTNNYLYVIDDSINGPYPVVREPLVEFVSLGKGAYTVRTEHDTYTVERALNCGCGSRLRGLHPFAGVPFVSQL